MLSRAPSTHDRREPLSLAEGARETYRETSTQVPPDDSELLVEERDKTSLRSPRLDLPAAEDINYRDRLMRFL